MSKIDQMFGALLAFPWEKSKTSSCEIYGCWAEDGSTYVVSCPSQLRDQLVNLQVQLYSQLASLHYKKDAAIKHENALLKVLCD